MIISKTEITEQNEYGATVKIHCLDVGSFIIEKYLYIEGSTIGEELYSLIQNICGNSPTDLSKLDFYNETQLAMSKAESSDNEVLEFRLEAFSSNVKIYGRGQIPWEVFSRLADFNYDSGYGCQEFDGWITFNNPDAYIQRDYYDGAEWWKVVRRPKLREFKVIL